MVSESDRNHKIAYRKKLTLKLIPAICCNYSSKTTRHRTNKLINKVNRNIEPFIYKDLLNSWISKIPANSFLDFSLNM